jgi:hypothetical protein
MVCNLQKPSVSADAQDASYHAECRDLATTSGADQAAALLSCYMLYCSSYTAAELQGIVCRPDALPAESMLHLAGSTEQWPPHLLFNTCCVTPQVFDKDQRGLIEELRHVLTNVAEKRLQTAGSTQFDL